MIQSAQVASKFTLFTHHAKTFPDLITALRNSMLRAGVFKDERTAEEQVVSVLNFDIHLVKDFRGVRYIQRITECIPVEEKNEYTFDHRNEATLEGKLDKFMDNTAIFYGKTTNRELYKYRNIMEYVNDGYILTNPISETNINEMRINMEDSDVEAFDNFLEKNWGIRPQKLNKDIKPVELDEIISEIPIQDEEKDVLEITDDAPSIETSNEVQEGQVENTKANEVEIEVVSEKENAENIRKKRKLTEEERIKRMKILKKRAELENKKKRNDEDKKQ